MAAESPRPRPLMSLTASAKRLTSKSISSAGTGRKSFSSSAWQEEAWDMYDLVGEYRYLVGRLAATMSQARLYVGRVEAWGAEPEEVDETEADKIALLQKIGGTAAGLGQIIQRLSINLSTPGEGWLVGIPDTLLPDDVEVPDEDTLALGETGYLWRMLSISEISANSSTGEVTLDLGEGSGGKITVRNPDDLYLIRVWRPHPRRLWEADSPTRAALPVLRELVGLTMHISAQVDSRLAGAGMLIVPQSAQRALNVAAGVEDEESDQFTEALIEAMLTPIRDRGSASALVPLVVTVPDEATDKFKHISFAQPLDEEARELREEAIRRLALSMDAPPELLLGTASMNHWGNWLVQEDTIRSHIEPPLALICDALTTQYLWPRLVEEGLEQDEAMKYVVWYDVEHLIVRPNRSSDAKDLHSRGVISDEALLRETGFDARDALESGLEESTALVLGMIQANPSLIVDPGVDVLMTAMKRLLSGQTTEAEPDEDATDDVDAVGDGEGEADDATAPVEGTGEQDGDNPAGPLPERGEDDGAPEVG